jgi:transposase-like protein
MRKQSSKSQKFMEYIMNHPNAKVAPVAKKFGITPSLGYQLRKKAMDGAFAPPEMVPMPEPRLPDWAFGDNVDKTLNTRAKDYGTFKDGAALMQSLKRSLADHAARHNKAFADDQWEALEMIVHKMGRIVNGNPDVVDHWVDIAGYATLIADRLEGRAR